MERSFEFSFHHGHNPCYVVANVPWLTFVSLLLLIFHVRSVDSHRNDMIHAHTLLLYSMALALSLDSDINCNLLEIQISKQPRSNH